MTPRSVSAKKLALIEQDPGKRMGNWEKLVHPVARRAYFVNKDTGQASWTTPAEVMSKLVLVLVLVLKVYVIVNLMLLCGHVSVSV